MDHALADPSAPASGPLVPEGAKSVVASDLNGDGCLDHLVGINDGPVRSLVRTGGPLPYRVSLEGPAGNLRGIGARISIRLSDDSLRTGEIRAGAGYLSQAQPPFTFSAPDGTTPATLTVRWPDGAVTTSRLPTGEREFLIRKPWLFYFCRSILRTRERKRRACCELGSTLRACRRHCSAASRFPTST